MFQKLRRLALALGVCGLAASSVAAQTLPPGSGYRVVGVASKDTLNVRVGPATSYPVVSSLAPSQTGLTVEVCVPTLAPQQRGALTPGQLAQVDAMPVWCLIGTSANRIGWVNARFLSLGSGQGGSAAHRTMCQTNPQVFVDLANASNWQSPAGRPPAYVSQNFPPTWDRALLWMSTDIDAGRGRVAGRTAHDFVIPFCSCSDQPATYQITRMRVDDRAEIFLDNVNWTDIAMNFRADMPFAQARKTSVKAGQRQFMLRIHNDPGFADNPFGFAVTGSLSAQNSYLGSCR